MADLLYAGVIEKMAGDTFAEAMDFTGIIPSGVTATSFVNTVYNAAGVTTTGIVTSASAASPIDTLTISTGSTEQTYLIKCVAHGSNSKTYTLTKLLNVSLPGVYR